MNKITNLSESRKIRMCDMDIGQIGIVTDEDFAEKFVLCTPNYVIDLEDPRYFWFRDMDIELYVRILPKGTKLELEIKE
jgi:hypothetical protein